MQNMQHVKERDAPRPKDGYSVGVAIASMAPMQIGTEHKTADEKTNGLKIREKRLRDTCDALPLAGSPYSDDIGDSSSRQMTNSVWLLGPRGGIKTKRVNVLRWLTGKLKYYGSTWDRTNRTRDQPLGDRPPGTGMLDNSVTRICMAGAESLKT